MAPTYFAEYRYSYLANPKYVLPIYDFEVATPEGTFERQVQTLYLEGQRRLQQEEYTLALNAFRELQALILKTANPQLPSDPIRLPDFHFPIDIALIDTLTLKTAEILSKTPTPTYTLPKSIVSEQSILPESVERVVEPLIESGIHVTSYQADVKGMIEQAIAKVGSNDWETASQLYRRALEQIPDDDLTLRASLLHDLSIITEKTHNREQAIEFGQQSAKLFGEVGQPEAQVRTLELVGGMWTRAGNQDRAETILKRAQELRVENNLDTIVIRPELREARLRADLGVSGLNIANRFEGTTVDFGHLMRREGPNGGTIEIQPHELELAAAAPDLNTLVLMGTAYLDSATVERQFTVLGLDEVAKIKLNGDGMSSVKDFLGQIEQTVDIGLLTNFWYNPPQIVAYIPHMYFFIVPMAIGDCLAGMGNLAEAANQYEAVLVYPFINKKYEAVKLWTRLADTYLDIGDSSYRRARDNVAAYSTAQAAYEKIIKADGTLDDNSPLYKDATFSGIKARVQAFLGAADPLAVDENPQIISLITEARTRLQQIGAGLNFFGFAQDYTPPFSFEYLQTTARYFAQQASQIEQRYIQYKSMAEDEEFRREQLDQQADIARQSVILEQRGLAEAQAGVAVAQAGLNYAEVQRQNAVEARDDFNNVRWELLEYAEAEAWAQAAAVDEDDEVQQTWRGNYYNARSKDRSDVIQDLAYRRTRITHDLEANKLQRAIESAEAYKQVAQAQVNQAQARVAVAQQRIVVAQLQQRFAEENRDFLDMKEFSARLWYELARQARRITRRYLDMATEVAFLMERAYNAETERNLHTIRYDYSQTSAGNLMGADLLLLDIDSFTYDHVTTTLTKKIPIKQVISLADSYAMPFQRLKTTGHAHFETSFEDFDRQHAGLYLCKLRNVELIFVGITSATGIAGTLRNVGVSRFRQSDGAVVTRLYPSDVLPLSQYDIRQDALAFRFNPNDLRLFENNGIDTLWQLDLPLDANDFDYDEILDIHLVLYYDGFFSPELEQTIRAALPNTGEASRVFSMRMTAPDELFYLKNRGDAELVFDAGLFPRNQTNLKRTAVAMKVVGDAAVINGLTLRLTSSVHGSEITATTDADGEINNGTAGQPLAALVGESMLDTWTIAITAADNPQLVVDGTLNLTGLRDVLTFFEYSFDYR